MKDWSVTQKRFLQAEIPFRLGEIAANLARIKSFSNNELNREAVVSLIEESKFFIEWTAIDAGIDKAAELVELQVQLAGWQLNWANIWADDTQRVTVAQEAKVWSDRVLEMSGLLSDVATSATQG
jgi:hypothetical protein